MYICVVCGYDGMEYPQWDEKGYPTYTVCDCCGFESGFHDDNLEMTLEEYRCEWIEEGVNWFNRRAEKPMNWNLREQLKRINVELT